MKEKDSKVEKVVLGFRDFLTTAWPAFLEQLKQVPATNQEYVIDDWLQFNWEVLVEAALCQYREYLLAYSGGGDINGASDRVIAPNALATHAIVCIPKYGTLFTDAFDGQSVSADACEWDKFVTLSNCKSKYYDAPPFDYVLFLKENNKLMAVPVEEVTFKMILIE